MVARSKQKTARRAFPSVDQQLVSKASLLQYYLMRKSTGTPGQLTPGTESSYQPKPPPRCCSTSQEGTIHEGFSEALKASVRETIGCPVMHLYCMT